MCTAGFDSRIYSHRVTTLPVIVGIVLIVTNEILTGISRFG
jgi:hypothetical protein